MRSMQVIHDIDKRNRMHLKKEKFPHPDFGVRILDKIVFYLAFIVPWAALPQIYNIWINKSVGGVSAITWGIYMTFAIPMFLYGYVHKSKPIMVMYGLHFLVDLTIVLGVLLA